MVQFQHKRKGFYRLTKTGEIYAIDTGPDGRLLGICGPLQENTLSPLQGYDFSREREIIHWLSSRKQELLSLELLE